jgi:hypothetical protein
MSDVPAGAGGTPDEAGAPVRVLGELHEQPSEEFLGKVLDVINARQTSGQAVEMFGWGATKLVLELFESFLGAVGIRPHGHDEESR